MNMNNTNELLTTEAALHALLDDLENLKSAAEQIQSAGAISQQVTNAADQVTRNAAGMLEKGSRLLTILEEAQLREKLQELQNLLSQTRQQILEIDQTLSQEMDRAAARHRDNQGRLSDAIEAQTQAQVALDKKFGGVHAQVQTTRDDLSDLINKVGRFLQNAHNEDKENFQTQIIRLAELTSLIENGLQALTTEWRAANDDIKSQVMSIDEEAKKRDAAQLKLSLKLIKTARTNRILLIASMTTSGITFIAVIYSLIRLLAMQ